MLLLPAHPPQRDKSRFGFGRTSHTHYMQCAAERRVLIGFREPRGKGGKPHESNVLSEQGKPQRDHSMYVKRVERKPENQNDTARAV